MTFEEVGAYQGGAAGRLRRFYRGITFQAIILGLVSFTQPGIWVALNSECHLSKRHALAITDNKQTLEPVVKQNHMWSMPVSRQIPSS